MQSTTFELSPSAKASMLEKDRSVISDVSENTTSTNKVANMTITPAITAIILLMFKFVCFDDTNLRKMSIFVQSSLFYNILKSKRC